MCVCVHARVRGGVDDQLKGAQAGCVHGFDNRNVTREGRRMRCTCMHEKMRNQALQQRTNTTQGWDCLCRCSTGRTGLTQSRRTA